ncbi:LacI family transcriptional regulator [Asaia sp. W19]|uniref:LacI family DNA-binding transcriptional regulator n=1 Tax=unclassified Asaia TaxID=2685023 RepID=UPI000F8CF66D|nr:LacI family DNA-binding transcriptional regulator [Asaia sp. W19]RUT25800.1 LacI family transcriptional regulator [Asaia sp. W19]
MTKPVRPPVVSLLNVAQEAGVSRATASLVLRESPLVAEATRERVREAMQRLGYIYNRGAANLRQSRTGTIGLVLSNIANPFFSALAGGVDEVNDEADVVGFIAASNESVDRQLRQIQRLREHNVDGVIICPAIGSDDRLLSELERLALPFVQVLREIEATRGDYVAADYALGVRLAIAHLVSEGRRRIVFVGNMPVHSAALARLRGYEQAIGECGLEAQPVIAGSRDNRFDTEAFDALLASATPPDAAICYNDIIALDLMHHIQSRGLTVGRDIAVIGMDDLPQAAASYPALTTVATSPRLIGRKAASLLQKRLAMPGRERQRVVMAPELVLRASTGLMPHGPSP